MTTRAGKAKVEPRCQDCVHEPEYGESLSSDGRDWCYDCGFRRFESRLEKVEKHPCPKCGSEMTRWYYVDGWPKDRERFDKLVCNCGHEEKLKDGEKR